VLVAGGLEVVGAAAGRADEVQAVSAAPAARTRATLLALTPRPWW